MKVRRQVYDLSPEDLAQASIWEFALGEEGDEDQDEATVKPVALRGSLDPSDGMFIVHAQFTLADGSSMSGYLTPSVQGERGLDTQQPAIVLSSGQVSFWCGVIPPSATELGRCYGLLGKSANEVFPISFQSTVPLVGGAIAGTVPGFIVLKDFETGETEVIS
jgi:hypothetical protein